MEINLTVTELAKLKSLVMSELQYKMEQRIADPDLADLWDKLTKHEDNEYNIIGE